MSTVSRIENVSEKTVTTMERRIREAAAAAPVFAGRTAASVPRSATSVPARSCICAYPLAWAWGSDPAGVPGERPAPRSCSEIFAAALQAQQYGRFCGARTRQWASGPLRRPDAIGGVQRRHRDAPQFLAKRPFALLRKDRCHQHEKREGR